MGGHGSGRWYRWRSRVTVGACLKLDVRALQRRKVLTPGNVVSWVWRRDGEPVADIRVRVWSDAITLTYRCGYGGGDWEGVTETVPLDWTACHYGGRRPW